MKDKLKISEFKQRDIDNILELVEIELDYLVASKDVQIDGNDLFNSVFYISRKSLFTNSKFLIKPSEFEIDSGILVAGHRFTPFCSSKLFASKIKLTDSTTLKNISKKKLHIKISDLMIYYTILGFSVMHEELGYFDENHEKITEMFNSDPEFVLNVFNMSKFYKETAFNSGDYILAEVIDYNKGICNIEYLPAKSLINSVGDISNWCHDFQEAVLETVKKYDNCTHELNIYKQLSEAFYIADKSLLEQPVIHLGGFLNFSEKVEMVNNDSNTILWEVDREYVPPARSLLNESIDKFSVDDGNIDEDFMDMINNVVGELDPESLEQFTELLMNEDNDRGKNKLKKLDDILEYMGYNLGEEELIAYMRDELYSGSDKLETVKNRCYDDRDEFYPEVSEKLHILTDKLWKKVKKSYNVFADKRVAELRHRLLELNDKNNKWQRNIDGSDGKVTLDDIPKKLFDVILEMTPQLMFLLIDLNKPNKLKAKDIKLMETMIDQAVPIMNMTLDHINEVVEELKN